MQTLIGNELESRLSKASTRHHMVGNQNITFYIIKLRLRQVRWPQLVSNHAKFILPVTQLYILWYFQHKIQNLWSSYCSFCQLCRKTYVLILRVCGVLFRENQVNMIVADVLVSSSNLSKWRFVQKSPRARSAPSLTKRKKLVGECKKDATPVR